MQRLFNHNLINNTMKRQIKFRAWDNQDKRMITNGCLGAGSSCQLIIIEWAGGLSLCNAYGLPDGTNPTFDKPVTERFEIMQFTGLKDKNGKEIYEGDILRAERWAFVWIVQWDEKKARFNCIINKERKHNDFIPTTVVEIIGNIFENPELLEAVA
jgi:uncharacterized phage protein (TIGR01671 family)